ncbi:putative minor capsid protein [Enterococcus termitis]
MLIQKPPKETLIEEFDYREFLGEGDYNKPRYGESIKVKSVRIDRTPKYTFGSQGKQILFNATVFCYVGLTTPLPEFKEQDMLIFDGREHTVVSARCF